MRSMTRQVTRRQQPREAFNSSVIYSLAEVARMERERQEEEELLQAKAREERDQQLRVAEAERRRAEEARRAAEEVERHKRERETAETRAVAEARARAVIEAARIEAEGRARLAAEAADREFKLDALRVRSETGARWLKRALLLLLSAVSVGGGVAAYTVMTERNARNAELVRLRGDVSALSQELTRVKSDELGALTRRSAALHNRPAARDASAAMTSADDARKAIDEKNIDASRLSSFRSALDQLDERLDTLERSTTLDRRFDNLSTWTAQKPGNDFVHLQTVATRAKDTRGNDAAALATYERTLDKWRDALGRSTTNASVSSAQAGTQAALRGAGSRGSGSSSPSASRTSPGPACRDGDPLCDLRGRSL